MTKEELKQEAEEYTKNLLKKLGIKEDMLLENQPKYLRQESMNFVALDVENVTDAYLASAEPREKRIAELEKSCDETQELLDKQIEATYKLDKENAELKHESRAKENCWNCAYFKEKKYQACIDIKKNKTIRCAFYKWEGENDRR